MLLDLTRTQVASAEAAGAVAMLVVDNGQCSEDFMACGRTGGVPEGGFAHKDNDYAWSKVRIPALMISQAQGARIKALMQLRTVTVSGLGVQQVH